MTRKFHLPVLDQGEGYTLYDLPAVALSNTVAVSAELEVWHDEPNRPEVILTGDMSSDPDLRQFLTHQTEKRISQHLASVGLIVTSVSAREPGAHALDQIIYNVEIQ
jgi:hypothetical protein